MGCVEGLNADGEQVAGEHAVCQWVDANNASEVSAIYNNLIPGSVWNGGALTGTGAPIAGSVNNASALGFAAAVEEAVEEAVEDASEAVDEAVEDAFQGDDDWGDEVEDAAEELADAGEEAADDAVDAAVEEVEVTVEATVEAIPALPAATFTWFQPKTAKTYEGLKRYSGGDKVQAFSLVAVDEELTATKQGDVQTLTGASALAATVIAFGALSLHY